MNFLRITDSILLLLVVVLLAACGGGGGSSSETSSPAQEPPAAEEEPPPCPTIHPHEFYTAIGDSLTDGVGDDAAWDNVTADGCKKGKGFTPVLVDLLNKEKNRKHTVVDKGVRGARSLEGSRSVGALLHNDTMHFLILYGTNDSNDSNGAAVNPNRFKTNMQSIIDQIQSAGKNAYLAKIPPVQGDLARNQLIEKYNEVIDELVSDNGINIKPPDFYGFFKAHPEFYSDDVHLNGLGYRRMASLWFQRIRSL